MSENHGVKEETFNQTSRRNGDGKMGQGGHTARQRLLDWVVPHSCADKPGEITREQDSLHNPGFQYGEIKPQSF